MKDIYINHPNTYNLTLGIFNLYNSSMNYISDWKSRSIGNTFEATEILDYLYLGNIDNVYCTEELQKRKIRVIISCIQGFVPPQIDGVEFIVLHCLDSEDAQINNVFEEMYNIIEQANLNSHKVLIHCMAGRSRSASIVLAYLIRKFKISHTGALQNVLGKRHIVQPNESFMEQLKEYSLKYT